MQRKQLKAIIDTLLPACVEPDMDTGAPFRAQAIIANPPALGEFPHGCKMNLQVHLISIFFKLADSKLSNKCQILTHTRVLATMLQINLLV